MIKYTRICMDPIFLLFMLTLYSPYAYSQSVPEEAKRYMNRGQAAVETAKTVADYEDAIREFEKAAKLAPNWADVYYNLGIVQEKVEKYADALRSLKRYLQLAPNAPDVKQVQALINKIEYKKEKATKERQLAEKKKEILSNFNIEEWDRKVVRAERDGYDQVVFPYQIRNNGGRILVKVMEYTSPRAPYQYSEVTARLDGDVLEYEFISNQSARGDYRDADCLTKIRIEIVSGTCIRVKARLYPYNQRVKNYLNIYELNKK